MNKLRNLFPALLLMGALLSGCTRDQCNYSRTYTKYTPEYMSYDEFRAAVGTEAPKTLKNPGKIYFKDNFVFVNEYLKGIHIIDNSNPASPQIVSFINIPGNVDMAAKGNMLYADSYVDLVVINVTDPVNASEAGRIQNIFEYQTYVYDQQLNPALGVVKNWSEEVVTENIVTDCDYYSQPGFRTDVLFNQTGQNVGSGGISTTNGAGSTPMPSNGLGGSMARFAAYQDYLYVITDKGGMKIFNTSEASAPVYERTLEIGWDLETIFPYQDRVYIGSRSGMYIYDVTDPAHPSEISFYTHITSCDPVVVEENTAYVTLRNGTPCFGYTNQLDIVDLTTPTAPRLVASHDMFNPHGLGVDSKMVFICDGSAGLKIFDASNPLNLGHLAEYANISTYDVIPLANQKVLLMIGENGLYQYDYSDESNISQLSVIPVVR